MFLVITVTVTIVSVFYLVTRSAENDLANKVDAYGANIVVAPQTKDLPLSYGGVTLGGLTYDVQPLQMADLDTIRAIPNKQNINRVAPVLLGPIEIVRRKTRGGRGRLGARAGSQDVVAGHGQSPPGRS